MLEADRSHGDWCQYLSVARRAHRAGASKFVRTLDATMWKWICSALHTAALPTLLCDCADSAAAAAAASAVANEKMLYGTNKEALALSSYLHLAPQEAVRDMSFAVWGEDHAHDWLAASPDGLLSSAGLEGVTVGGGVSEDVAAWVKEQTGGCEGQAGDESIASVEWIGG